MRHSFMPNQDQRLLKRSYRTRVAAVAYIMITCAILVSTASFVPSYASIVSKKASLSSELASISGASVSGLDSLRKELEADMSRLRVLSTQDPIKSSVLIIDVINARGPVRLMSVSIDAISSTTATIILQGVAPTRDTLVAFKNRLEGLSLGNKVELPISELTKSKDISFSLKYTTIIP